MKAIVYTSYTGHTAQYAELLEKELNLPVYSLEAAPKSIPDQSDIIYLGWVMASHIKGYATAAKRYNIKAVCGVGLVDIGDRAEEMKKATGLPDDLPLFPLEGGYDINKLHGFYKWSMKMMSKVLSNAIAKNPDPSESDLKTVQVLKQGGDFVCKENLSGLLEWYRAVCA